MSLLLGVPLGILVYIFLMVPNLSNKEDLKLAGEIMIALSVFDVVIYTGLRRLISSRSQRKLKEWMRN
ncbi:MAG: hypothetical protein QXZ07_06885 [Nitrososphaerales archaeon]